MELFSKETAHLAALVGDWKTYPEIELEATFGFNGMVDMQTFLRVISRLKSKGYTAMEQEDRLTIGLQDSLRFTLVGAGTIKRYCYDNRIDGKDFVVIAKDRSISKENEDKATLDLKEYDVRIKARREKPFAQDDALVLDKIKSWKSQRKYFRLIRRWTFKNNKGVKFDLSMVRSNPRGMVYNFNDQNIIGARPTYEIEVELNRSDFKDDSTVEQVQKGFLQGIGEILRGIQNTPLLIRKSVKEDVLKQYKILTGTPLFRGVPPVTLHLKHMEKTITKKNPNIRTGYNVTDKADGLRVHAFTNNLGELYMIDMAFNVYKTGLRKQLCRDSLLDGEYVTEDKEGKSIQELHIFDVYIDKNKNDISKEPFQDGRHDALEQWMMTWNSDGGPEKQFKSSELKVAMKKFFFAKGDDIFEKARNVLNNKSLRSYNTDGLIFTPNTLGLPQKPGDTFYEQFKWKPAEDNTIDFLVRTEKKIDSPNEDDITLGIKPVTEEEFMYKTLRLFVGSTKDPAWADPRGTILDMRPLPSTVVQVRGRDGRPDMKPILFNPKDIPDLMANVCYMAVERDPETNEEIVKTERTEEPIRDKSIVEMRYDPSRPPGWRWIPIRVRLDKTERFLKGTVARTLNGEKTANDIWNSIHEPVTEHMITTGSEQPSLTEQRESQGAGSTAIAKKYVERKATGIDLKKVSGMRLFHRLYIKENLLYGAIFSGKPNKKIIDLTVGKGGDLPRWIEGGADGTGNKAGFVLGIDAAGESIRSIHDGAYQRLLSIKDENAKKKESETIPPILFVIGDSSRPLIDGSAGADESEKNILRSLFGVIEPTAPIPKLVQDYAGTLSNRADVVVCVHALHYFFETEEKFNGILNNIKDTLKVGGLFAGTNFDGGALFNFLKDQKKGESRVGQDDKSIIWEITKQYDADDLPIDNTAFGMPVDVNFITIGVTHREYLVPWELLLAKMRSIGCELVPQEELADMGLKHSTNMYSSSFEMARKDKKLGRDISSMPEIVRQYSFLNRWYIFKRVSEGLGTVGDIIQGEEIPVVLGAEGMKAEQKATLAELSAAAQNSGTITDFVQSMVAPGSLAAAERMIKTQEGTVVEVPGGPIEEVRAPGLGPLAAVPTVPVKNTVKGILGQKKYNLNQLFQFKEDSIELDRYLQLPEKYKSYAARHMAPNAPFRIMDTTDPSDKREFPSITHFLAGMKFKYASSQPTKASEFDREGPVHRRFEEQRRAAHLNKGLTKERQQEIILLETNAIIAEELRGLLDPKVGYNESTWSTKKDLLLRTAIEQRLKYDKKLCVIVDAIITQEKYPLYVVKNISTNELGGKVKPDKTIEGENKYGKTILEMATSSPDVLKACLALPDPM